MTNTGFFTTPRIAGMLILLSVLIGLGAAGAIAAQGRLPGMEAAFRGVSYAAGDASGLRTIGRAMTPSLMAQLAGFALLTLLLLKAGDQGAALIALTLLVFATVIAALEVTFHASVTVWAAGAGSAPEFYEPLRRWLNYDVQRMYISFMLTAMLLFSWSALHRDVLPAWIGWAALGWSLLSFPLYFSVTGAPVVYLPAPLLLGIGLVWRG